MFQNNPLFHSKEKEMFLDIEGHILTYTSYEFAFYITVKIHMLVQRRIKEIFFLYLDPLFLISYKIIQFVRNKFVVYNIPSHCWE